MSTYWEIVVPEATTNEILNPSFEVNVTDGWTLAGGGTAARSGARAYIGVYCLQLTSAVGVTNYLQSGAISVANGGVVSIQARLWRNAAVTSSIRIRDTTNGADRATGTPTSTSEWEELTASWTNTTGGAVNVVMWLVNSEQDGASNLWFDACQMEALGYVTTYADGGLPGCEWNGTKHNSTSTRSAQSRAGGRVYNLDTDYGFNIETMTGVGAASQSLQHAEYEQLPGGKTSGMKVNSRAFSLGGIIYPTTDMTDLHAQRQALFSVLDPDAVPRTARGPQPVLLRYTNAAVTKEIAAHYEAGLEGNFSAPSGDEHEKFALRFLADDPFWYEIGQSAAVLDSNDTATTYYLAARLRSTGQWSNLGLTAIPDTGGTINAVLEASDGTVYYGGEFTNFDGGALDYLVKYTPSTATWAQVGAGGGDPIGAAVYALAEGPDGVIYIGGAFTNAGDANGDYLCKYTPSTDVIASVSGGGTGQVLALVFDLTGLLYIGGDFAIWNAVNESEAIVTWNGTAYAAVADGFGAQVNALAVTPDGTVYAGGAFTTDWDGGNPFLYFASWDGTTWTQCGGGPGNVVATLCVSPNGMVTLGGSFTNVSSIANADYVAQWNGTAYTAMGTGANGSVTSLSAAPNGDIIAMGNFSSIGGITTRIGRWNGSSWTPLDIGMPGTPAKGFATFGNPDPVISHNFDHWIGFNTTGAAYFAGATTVTNSGTAPVYPRLVIKRTGGTSATIISLRNETTGEEISFNNYALRDGETLTVDLAQKSKAAMSDFFGKRGDAILYGSDTGIWHLQPGANNITCYVAAVGAPTVVAYLLWRDSYKAID